MTDTGVRGRVEPTRIQRVVARRMAASHATVPDFALEVDIDMEPAVRWREAARSAGGRAPSFNDMIVRACAKALARHPRANGSWVDDAFEFHEQVDIGIAVATEGSLVVPVIRDVANLTTLQIGAEARRLVAAVTDGSIRANDLSGGTFTVSNLGMFGVDRFSAMVNPPQAAILAAGAIGRRVVPDGDGWAIRHVVTVTMSCDHRILYGADGAAFLGSVREELQAPESLDES